MKEFNKKLCRNRTNEKKKGGGRIREITRQMMHPSTGCIKSNETMLIIENEKYFKDGTDILVNSSTAKEENMKYNIQSKQ